MVIGALAAIHRGGEMPRRVEMRGVVVESRIHIDRQPSRSGKSSRAARKELDHVCRPFASGEIVDFRPIRLADRPQRRSPAHRNIDQLAPMSSTLMLLMLQFCRHRLPCRRKRQATADASEDIIMRPIGLRRSKINDPIEYKNTPTSSGHHRQVRRKVLARAAAIRSWKDRPSSRSW